MADYTIKTEVRVPVIADTEGFDESINRKKKEAEGKPIEVPVKIDTSDILNQLKNITKQTEQVAKAFAKDLNGIKGFKSVEQSLVDITTSLTEMSETVKGINFKDLDFSNLNIGSLDKFESSLQGIEKTLDAVAKKMNATKGAFDISEDIKSATVAYDRQLAAFAKSFKIKPEKIKVDENDYFDVKTTGRNTINKLLSASSKQILSEVDGKGYDKLVNRMADILAASGDLSKEIKLSETESVSLQTVFNKIYETIQSATKEGKTFADTLSNTNLSGMADKIQEMKKLTDASREISKMQYDLDTLTPKFELNPAVFDGIIAKLNEVKSTIQDVGDSLKEVLQGGINVTGIEQGIEQATTRFEKLKQEIVEAEQKLEELKSKGTFVEAILKSDGRDDYIAKIVNELEELDKEFSTMGKNIPMEKIQRFADLYNTIFNNVKNPDEYLSSKIDTRMQDLELIAENYGKEISENGLISDIDIHAVKEQEKVISSLKQKLDELKSDGGNGKSVDVEINTENVLKEISDISDALNKLPDKKEIKISITDYDKIPFLSDEAGKTIDVFRGLNGVFGFTGKDGISWFVDDLEMATQYADKLVSDGKVIKANLAFKNPLEINGNGAAYDKIEYNGRLMQTDDIVAEAKKLGYDGVIFKNIQDGFDNVARNVFVTVDQIQVKNEELVGSVLKATGELKKLTDGVSNTNTKLSFENSLSSGTNEAVQYQEHLQQALQETGQQGQIAGERIAKGMEEATEETNKYQAILDESFQTSGKKEATDQLRNTYKEYQKYFETDSLESGKIAREQSDAGREAGYRYAQALKEAIKQNISEKTLDTYRITDLDRYTHIQDIDYHFKDVTEYIQEQARVLNELGNPQLNEQGLDALKRYMEQWDLIRARSGDDNWWYTNDGILDSNLIEADRHLLDLYKDDLIELAKMHQEVSEVNNVSNETPDSSETVIEREVEATRELSVETERLNQVKRDAANADMGREYLDTLDRMEAETLEVVEAQEKLKVATGAEASAQGAAEESQKLDDVTQSANDAAEAKKGFADANGEVLASIVESLKGLNEEGNGFENLTKLINSLGGKNGDQKLQNIVTLLEKLRDVLSAPVDDNALVNSLKGMSDLELSSLSEMLKNRQTNPKEKADKPLFDHGNVKAFLNPEVDKAEWNWVIDKAEEYKTDLKEISSIYRNVRGDKVSYNVTGADGQSITLAQNSDGAWINSRQNIVNNTEALKAAEAEAKAFKKIMEEAYSVNELRDKTSQNLDSLFGKMDASKLMGFDASEIYKEAEKLRDTIKEATDIDTVNASNKQVDNLAKRFQTAQQNAERLGEELQKISDFRDKISTKQADGVINESEANKLTLKLDEAETKIKNVQSGIVEMSARSAQNIVEQISTFDQQISKAEAATKEAVGKAEDASNTKAVADAYKELERAIKAVNDAKLEQIRLEKQYSGQDQTLAQAQANVATQLQAQLDAESKLENLGEQRATIANRVAEATAKAAQSLSEAQVDQKQSYSNDLDKWMKDLQDWQRSGKYVQTVTDQMADLNKRMEDFKKRFENIKPSNLEEATKKMAEFNAEYNKSKDDRQWAENKKAAEASLAKLELQINSFMNKNSAMGQKFKDDFEGLKLDLKAADNNKDVAELAARIASLKSEVEEAGKTGKSFFDTIKERAFSSSAQFLSQYFSLQDWLRYGRTAIETIKDLDYALVDLQKTTTMSGTQLNAFYLDANNVAKQMGTTTQQIIEQASAWSRLGYSSQHEATEMAKLSSQFAMISPGMELDNATDGLVSTMQAFHISVDDVEREIMDNVNRIGKYKLPKRIVIYGVY